MATAADALVDVFAAIGVAAAYGVGGGAIAPVWEALSASSITTYNTRHESGAGFAALEHSLATRRPTVVFATTGPGLLNALTGLAAAGSDGATVVAVVPVTAASRRGRHPLQDTTPGLVASLGGPDGVFDEAFVIEHVDQVPVVARRLAVGAGRPGPYVAAVALSLPVQTARCDLDPQLLVDVRAVAAPTPPPPAVATLDACVDALADRHVAVLTGFGARHDADAVTTLVEHCGAAVITTPRGKGIVDERHPHHVGVAGFAGHRSVADYVDRHRPERLVVLGSRLGEFSSYWDPELIPEGGIVHVDVDPTVFGAAYPGVATLAVPADIGELCRALVGRLPRRAAPEGLVSGLSACAAAVTGPTRAGTVHPAEIMAAVQRHVVDAGAGAVIADCGNSFAWTTHHLSFDRPGRYRMSAAFASMGNAAAGVVGLAAGTGRPAVAVVGDGAVLMLGGEVSTAVAHQLPAVWIVLNDASYGMAEQGNAVAGYPGIDTSLPATDFAAFARALGCPARRVGDAHVLDGAIVGALAARGPFLLDVAVDAAVLSPSARRFAALAAQKSS